MDLKPDRNPKLEVFLIVFFVLAVSFLASLPLILKLNSSVLPSNQTEVGAFPGGKQFHITLGNASAVITEVGATLREYKVGAQDVVYPISKHEMSGSHGQILIPFPNRVADGRYSFEGKSYQLPVNSVGDNTAIHGLVRFLPWKVKSHRRSALHMETELFPSLGYPFHVVASVQYVLNSDGLHVSYTVTNKGTHSLPVGIGAHPYFTLGPDLLDTNKLTVPANSYFKVNGHSIPDPATPVPVKNTEFDFREGKQIGETVLDVAFTDIIRDESGDAFVKIENQQGTKTIRVKLGPGCNFVQLYSSDTLREPRKRAALAVEPMSCPANAFNNKEGLRVLEPGECTTFSWAVLPDFPASEK